MGLLGIDSNSASQEQISATDNARLLRGKNSRYTESGSFQIGDKSTYTESGGINVGAKGTLKTGEFADATISGSTVNIGEQGLGATFAQTIKDLFSSQQATTSGLLESLLPAYTAEDPNAVPGDEETLEDSGATSKAKWVVIGIIALLGWWWWKSK